MSTQHQIHQQTRECSTLSRPPVLLDNPRVETVVQAPDFIRTISPILSADECNELIAASEAEGFAPAPITTPRGFVMRPDVRNNTRIMRDDHVLARHLWQRLQPFVPSVVDGWRAVGLNERLRFYRYEPGESFRWHFDGSFHRSSSERSMLTAMLYLDDDFSGGTTDFDHGDINGPLSIVPVRGMALVFAHAQRHQGASVRRGRKYVLRTDVMYRKMG